MWILDFGLRIGSVKRRGQGAEGRGQGQSAVGSGHRAEGKWYSVKVEGKRYREKGREISFWELAGNIPINYQIQLDRYLVVGAACSRDLNDLKFRFMSPVLAIGYALCFLDFPLPHSDFRIHYPLPSVVCHLPSDTK